MKPLLSRYVALALACSVGLCAAADSQAGAWVDIDTQSQTMTVYADSTRVLALYGNISIGRGGVASVHYRRQQTTPLGQFQIIDIRRPHRFTAFYLLNYPTTSHARMALAEGKISARAATTIEKAAAQHRLPPQSGPLGGGIGIHGIGRGDPAVHAAFNWTDGCIALSNEQLRDFARWAKLGMRVEVH